MLAGLPTNYIHWLSLEKSSFSWPYKSRWAVTILLEAVDKLYILIY